MIVTGIVVLIASLGSANRVLADEQLVTPGDGSGDGVADFVHMRAGTNGGSDRGSPEVETSPANGSLPNSTNQSLDPLAGLGQIQPDNTCGWSDFPRALPPEDPTWAGNSTIDGSIKWKSCAVLLPGTPGAPGNAEGRPVELQFFPNAAVGAPPPDPSVLAQQAYRELHIPQPAIGAGPDRSKLAVNLWTWLWVDDPGVLSATVAAGGVSVTASANLASVTWSLGEPHKTGDAYAAGVPASITCQGTGTQSPPGFDWKAQPPCGYMFHWRSLKERTGGTGKWPITATSTWNVTWQSNTGGTGATSLSATSADQFDIGEYRNVLVREPGG